MNEDLYDTGSAVVGLYRRFTNFLKFSGYWVDRLGGGGGGGGKWSPWDQRTFPLLSFIFHTSFNLFKITNLKLGKNI